MNIASLLLRATDNNGSVYKPYTLEGKFTSKERKVIEEAFTPHVPENVDAMFNNWLVAKIDSEYFFAKRATWDMGCFGTKTAQEMATKIRDYYEK